MDYFATLKLQSDKLYLEIDTSVVGELSGDLGVTGIQVQFNSLSSDASATTTHSYSFNNISDNRLNIAYTSSINLNNNKTGNTISVELCTIVNGGDSYFIPDDALTQISINNDLTISIYPSDPSTRWDKLKIVHA